MPGTRRAFPNNPALAFSDHIAFEATSEAVARARRRATAFALRVGATAELGERVALAVTEAVTNAVIHAYVNARKPGPVELELRVDDPHIVIHVRDHGRGLTPRPDSPGLGLGLPLIARVADKVELSSVDGRGTEVSMLFGLRAHDNAG